jgi:tetrahydromethanopterin S-methyltransferase subunit B
VEGDRGVLEALRTTAPVYLNLRNMRGSVLSLTRSLELFHPEIMVTIDQQVDLIFKLRDKGMPDVALLVEEIDQLEDNVKKCLNARTALEKTIEYYCKSKSVDVKQGFYTNLDNAIKAGLTEKTKRNAIAGHYSFMSKLIHGELETNPRNTQFAVTGALNILHSLVQ